MKQPIKIPRRLELLVAWAAVAVALVATLLGYLGPHLGGDLPGLRGLPGYAVEMVAVGWLLGGLLAALAALVAGLRRLRVPALLLGAVALAFLVPELWSRVKPVERVARAGEPTLRVASVNLAAWNEDDPLMRRSLVELDADVLVLSEFSRAWKRKLEGWFEDDYPHRFVSGPTMDTGRESDEYGQALWSRIEPTGPLEVVAHYRLEHQLRLPLRFDGRDLAIYGIHSRVPHPHWAYNGAFGHRVKLLTRLSEEELPTILAGDFNSPPRSAYLQRINELGFTSASASMHGRDLATWPEVPYRPKLLQIAIDYILSSDELIPTHYAVGPATKSDHLSIVAAYVWR